MKGSRQKYERIAWVYDLVDLPFEYGRYRRIRPLLFEGLGPRILDAGVGTGRNMPFYPAAFEVFAVDQSPAMLKRAANRIEHSPGTVHLVRADIAELPFPDAFFDAAVASFLLCTMDPKTRAQALAELFRVLNPNGRLRLLEYGPARQPLQRLAARLWQPWVRWAFGAQLDLDVEPDVRAAGFTILVSRPVTGSINYIEASPADNLQI